ncbi:Emp24/gp25L/p24_family/GOLD domain-containing protein [Hexamita inflata]|uniref:Emp24/gp25L/p24 family/GOLD domain-containing protein n=1 Tax=Hexamita inflata TaxID=28002 RepID=A0AA86PLL6_9EUKA|nr:Emp24/gp25L/p24 family/GOLD domain-containing protein [Hexamita inflata]
MSVLMRRENTLIIEPGSDISKIQIINFILLPNSKKHFEGPPLQQNISRDVFIEMEQTIVVHNFDDKFEAANQANLLSQAVISEQDYAKERVRELENASQRMNRAMIFTVVFSIFAAWATVLSQNSWLAVQIRKRM